MQCARQCTQLSNAVQRMVLISAATLLRLTLWILCWLLAASADYSSCGAHSQLCAAPYASSVLAWQASSSTTLRVQTAAVPIISHPLTFIKPVHVSAGRHVAGTTGREAPCLGLPPRHGAELSLKAWAEQVIPCTEHGPGEIVGEL